MSAENGYHDYSSDDSDHESDRQRYEDILSGSAFDESRWTYLRRNARAGEAYKGYPQRNLPEGAFKLDYNGVDSMLLDEAIIQNTQQPTNNTNPRASCCVNFWVDSCISQLFKSRNDWYVQLNVACCLIC